MIFIKTNRLKLKDYVSAAWRYDSKLPKFYDNNLPEKDYESMVADTTKKISDFYYRATSTEFYGIEIGSNYAGFVVTEPKRKILYSFGLNLNYRSSENLSTMFRFICSKLNNDFYCLLYKHNERAVNFLKRCGMQQIDGMIDDPEIVYLKYELCQ